MGKDNILKRPRCKQNLTKFNEVKEIKAIKRQKNLVI